MKQLQLYDSKIATEVVSTVFSDGMIVRADDLDTAMHYPLALLSTLVRAYFGCGVVCGLGVHVLEGKPQKPGFCLSIDPGVALDCGGTPLQLCKPVKVDLTPDPCACEAPPSCVYLALRRDTLDEAPVKESDAGEEGKPRYQYRRRREIVHVKVFRHDQLPKELCARTKPDPDGAKLDACECQKACAPCHCCSDSWLLLARIELNECGVTKLDTSRRKYVKPIECRCPPEPEPCERDDPKDDEPPGTDQGPVGADDDAGGGSTPGRRTRRRSSPPAASGAAAPG